MTKSRTKTMAGNRKATTRRSWLALYAALLSAIVFADPAAGGLSATPVAVSPVAVDTGVPALDVRAVVRRFDI